MFARLLHKPSVLVVGGYDVAKIPEIGYGHQRGGLKKWVSRWTMRSATQLLATSCFSSNEVTGNALIPKESVFTVYIGVPDFFETLPQSPRSQLILTVGDVDRPNLQRKGHEPFVQTAALMPDVDFVLVGAWKDETIQYLRSIATPNITFTGRIDDQRLLDYYRRASVYVQPSMHEGFGLSVAEAMLAGCIPVVSRFGSLPEVAGEHAVFVDQPSPENLAQAIQTALNCPDENRALIRQHILTKFPMGQRAQRLGRLIDSLSNPLFGFTVNQRL